MVKKQLYTITEIQINDNGNVYHAVLRNFWDKDRAMNFYRKVCADRCGDDCIGQELSPTKSRIYWPLNKVMTIIEIHQMEVQ